MQLLQKEAGVANPMRVVPLFEMKVDLDHCPGVMTRLFSIPSYTQRINGARSSFALCRAHEANRAFARPARSHAWLFRLGQST